MKIINYLKIGVLSLSLFGSVSCTDRFDSINTDPNYPTVATPDLLLNPLLRSLVQNQFNYNNGSGLAHHLARTNYNEVEQYAFGTNEGTWTYLYMQLNNIQELIRVSEQSNKPSSKAIGMILKAFVASQLTDLWGDVPYFEATKGGENITPYYDRQMDIYTAEGGILSLLRQAEELLSSSKDVLASDIVYAGDRTKWRKLGNSLRLRYLMRISNRAEEVTSFNVASEVKSVADLPLLTDNKDNMVLPFLAGSPNKCPIFDLRPGEFEYVRMSEEMANVLNKYHDPRMQVWFAPTTNSVGTDNPIFAGVPVGCSSTTLTEIHYSQADVSMLGDYYRMTPDGCSAVLMHSAEVKFLLAEAVLKGYISGQAKSFYEEGIRLSMGYYGIERADDYIAQSGVTFDEEDAYQQVMLQKWLSLFMVGYEAWFDFLRTGLPKQDALHDNRNPSESGGIPSRFYYPEDEQALNNKNYQDAVDRQGGTDNINSRLWWEK